MELGLLSLLQEILQPISLLCAPREGGVRLLSEASLLTCEFLELAAGRQDVGPQGKGAAPCAFSSYPYRHFSSFTFLCW